RPTTGRSSSCGCRPNPRRRSSASCASWLAKGITAPVLAGWCLSRRERKASRLAGAALAGQPRLAQLAALLLGGAAPDARLLVGGEGELEAGPLDVAGPAHGLGRLDLVDGRPGGAHGEEEIGVGVAAGRLKPPVLVGGCLGGPAPGQCHCCLHNVTSFTSPPNTDADA